MAYPSLARWLQYSGGRTPPRVFDPTVDTIQYIASIPGATRAFFRIYDSAGRYMYSRECAPAGGDAWSYTASYPIDSITKAPTGNNHILKLVFAGSITGGSWQLNWNGVNTASIGYNDTVGRRADIIGNHPDIGPGNVVCTWNAGTKTMTIEFINGRAHMKPDNRWGVGANNLSGSGALTITPSTQQMGVGDFPGRQGEYTWDMVGLNSDGWSGGVGGWNAREAKGPAKAGLWLDMPAGLTSISPANGATINTPTPMLSWAYTSGTILSVPVTTEQSDIYDSTGALLYTLQGSGRRIPLSVGLRSGQTYTWVLTVIKASGQTTTSTQTFTVSISRPAKLTATSNLYTDGHKIGVNWTASGLSSSVFVAYVIKVRPVGADEDGPQNVEVWSTTLQSRTYAYVLRFPRNRPFILSFYVRQLQFGSEVDSLPHEMTYTVPLDSLIVLNPTNHDYVLLRTHRGRGYGPGGDPEYTEIWGQPYPLFDAPTDTGVTLEGTATEEFSYQPVIYNKLYQWYVNPSLTAYIVSDAVGNVWDMTVNRPHQHIPGGRGVIEIDYSFRQVGSNHFGELS